MALPDQNLDTLGDIRIKVRRLTRSPSASQLTDAQIDDYINNFVLYDFPEFNNKKTLTFYTQPNLDTYETIDINADDPLYNFKNKFIKVNGPIYIDGVKAAVAETVDEFFDMFPIQYAVEQVGTGDGVTTVFAGTLSNTPILHNAFKIFSKDAFNYSSTAIDTPDIDPATRYALQTGALTLQNGAVGVGDINYLTGVFNVNFNPNAPAAGDIVSASYSSYTASKPTTVLFKDNTFTLRPIPDRAYKIDVSVSVRPIELLAAADQPELAQWWQYIAYGASKKVFEDRMDIESIKMIMPELENQQLMVQRRYIVQDGGRRARTIYSYVDVDNRNY